MTEDRNTDLDGARVGPPPDLPSLLLHNRIVYLGMPLVPAVTELIIAEVSRSSRAAECAGRWCWCCFVFGAALFVPLQAARVGRILVVDDECVGCAVRLFSAPELTASPEWNRGYSSNPLLRFVVFLESLFVCCHRWVSFPGFTPLHNRALVVQLSGLSLIYRCFRCDWSLSIVVSTCDRSSGMRPAALVPELRVGVQAGLHVRQHPGHVHPGRACDRLRNRGVRHQRLHELHQASGVHHRGGPGADGALKAPAPQSMTEAGRGEVWFC